MVEAKLSALVADDAIAPFLDCFGRDEAIRWPLAVAAAVPRSVVQSHHPMMIPSRRKKPSSSKV